MYPVFPRLRIHSNKLLTVEAIAKLNLFRVTYDGLSERGTTRSLLSTPSPKWKCV